MIKYVKLSAGDYKVYDDSRLVGDIIKHTRNEWMVFLATMKHDDDFPVVGSFADAKVELLNLLNV